MRVEGSSLFSMESLPREAPNPKLQAPGEVPSPKPQRAALDGRHVAITSLGPCFGAWDLELLWSLVFGAWSLGACGIPSKTARNRVEWPTNAPQRW